MSAKAVTCCIRIFEVLEGTDILNADILDMLASTLMDDFASTSFAIVSLDDPQESVILLHSVLSGIRSTALLLLGGILTQQIGDLLV